MKLTVPEVAALLKTSEERVEEWIEDGSLPSQRMRGEYRINRSELLEWATERKVVLAPRAFARSLTGNGMASIADALRTGVVAYDVRADDATAVIREIAASLPLASEGDREVLPQFLLARDAFGLAAVGGHIAVPQVRTPVVLPVGGRHSGAFPPPSVLSLSFLSQPVVLPGADREAVDTIFLLLSPTVTAHLVVLAALVACINDEVFRSAIDRRASRDEILNAASAAEGRL